MKNLATQIATAITKEAENQKPIEIIIYGLEILLNLGIQLSILALVGYFLGIFPTVMVSVLTAVVFRTFSGGNHFSTFISCTVISTVLFTGIGYISSQILIKPEVNIGLIMINTILVAKWAPYNPKRKYGWRKKRTLKLISISLLLGMFSLGMLLPVKESLVNAVALGLTWQTVSITPLGIVIIRKADQLIHKGKEGK